LARKKGLSPNIRAAALRLLYEVEVKGAYTNLLLDKELRHNSWGAADRALLTELVSGTTRMRKHLDWVLDLFLSRSIKKQNPWLRNILRMAAYQLLFLEKIPDYAVVNESVNLARARLGSSVSRLVNAVLRNLVRNRGRLTYPDPRKNPVEYLAVYYSHPEWLVVRWLARYGFDATRGLLEYDNLSPGVTVRTNFLRTDRQALLDSLRADECRCEASLLTPWGVRILNLAGTLRHLDAFRSGWFYVQDEASMLVTPALDPVENQLVYDLTAGVGGKTTHLAEMMNNQGVIRAGELHKGKLDVLRANTARLGITMVEACSCNLLESLPDEWGGR
jgi:16S rRNA (cytosine967-C5)-methyltransferase